MKLIPCRFYRFVSALFTVKHSAKHADFKACLFNPFAGCQKRTACRDDISEQIRTIADASLREAKAIDSPDLYSSTLRLVRHKKFNLKGLITDYNALGSEMYLDF